MDLTIPVYVEAKPGAGPAAFVCRLLFAPQVSAFDPELSRAMVKLARKAKPWLDQLGRDLDHRELARVLEPGRLSSERLKLTIELRDRRIVSSYLFVVADVEPRRVAFTPSVPQAWFELGRGESLETRATEVLTQHFRELMKADEDVDPARFGLLGKAWLTQLDLTIASEQQPRKDPRNLFAVLFGMGPINGADELRKVGRCLDQQYPDDLQRAHRRASFVNELGRLLAAKDRRPIALVGPRLAGKTTILHEVVYRRVAARKRQHRAARNVWLLSPQRLISGMSFVGQWENRLLAILDHARRKDHVLYFDDVLGLFHAGVSRDASLSVADVLKPVLQRRKVRVVGEMTEEQWQTLQQRDRGLADCFHVVRVPAASSDEARRLLLALRRQLEDRHRCEFAVDVVPTVVALHERFVRDGALPGTAARFLQRTAARYERERLDRNAIYVEFATHSGLAPMLVDPHIRLLRPFVLARLRSRVVGQAEALEALADVVMTTKAQLNSPDRPLGVFLMVGPTGVGKTETAKALAELLFNDEQRLLRFDMNEFVTPSAVSRLVGTWDEPEGLLTSAVRQQPFAVILLDEIEKAHPDLFDLLLQITGEGRLTDALGRTADFTHTVVLMTSNLAADEARRRLGFGADKSDGDVFRRAAEQFFRPELFNRIDRILPFRQLSRGEMRQIADLLIRDLLKREGLVRRRVLVDVDARALDWIVTAGYHPQLGARALKRAVEQKLVQPLAERLAVLNVNSPVVISVLAAPAGIAVNVQQLTPGPRRPPPSDVGRALEEFTTQIAECEEHAKKIHPTGPLTAGAISSEQLRYFALAEQIRKSREFCETLGNELEKERRLAAAAAKGARATVRPDTPRVRRKLPKDGGYIGYDSPVARRLIRDVDLVDELTQLMSQISEIETTDKSSPSERALALAAERGLLETLRSAPQGEQRALFVWRSVGAGSASECADIAAVYCGVLAEQLGFDCRYLKALPDDEASTDTANDNNDELATDARTAANDGGAAISADSPDSAGEPGEPSAPSESDEVAIEVGGMGILAIGEREAGVHLVLPHADRLVPLQLIVVPLSPGQDARKAWQELRGRRRAWRDAVARGEADAAADPTPLGPLVRLFADEGASIDFRIGHRWQNRPADTELKTAILAGLDAS